MRTHVAVTALTALALAFSAGCGVPRSQYDAAVSDAQKAKADFDAKLAAMQQANADLAAKLLAAEGKAAASDEATRAELDELRKQKAAADARLKLFDDFVAKFKKMIDAGKLDITVRRGQIVLALATDILFDPGKTDIKPDGVSTLGEVADTLKGVNGRRFQIAGHTDTNPIKTKEFPSNWELSTTRALAVVKLLVEKGVKPDALSAAGYAEFDPAQTNASERGRAKNRRIEIVLVPNMEELVKMPDVVTSRGDSSADAKDAGAGDSPAPLATPAPPATATKPPPKPKAPPPPPPKPKDPPRPKK